MLRSPDPGNWGIEDLKDLFVQYAPADMGEYSADEFALIFTHLLQDTEKLTLAYSRIVTLADIALAALLRFSKCVLRLVGNEPACRMEYVGDWRRAYLDLGQDTFVCSFLAWADGQSGYERKAFVWPAVIRTDHTGLNALLKRGLAENHQHLYGSSQSFPLSWCCMKIIRRTITASRRSVIVSCSPGCPGIIRIMFFPVSKGCAMLVCCGPNCFGG